MKWIIMVLIMVIAIMTVMLYSLLVIASMADDEAERMYREQAGERKDDE